MEEAVFQSKDEASLCRLCKKSPKMCENEVVKSVDLDKIYEYDRKKCTANCKKKTVKCLKYPFLIMCDYFDFKGKQLNG